MTRFSFGWLGVLARAALVAATAFVAACGSGAVSAPPTPPTTGPISITPSTATLYSDTPTTFIVTGGNGEYIIISSDQSALPVAGAFTGHSLVLVPNPVSADTPVTLTVRDTGASAPVTATLTVKPRTVSNVVTITPTATQSAACGTAVCSGGDAEVRVVLSQGGLPLQGRTVRFDVASGDVRVITSPAGVPEQTALTGTAVTDSSGTARIRIRVLPDAPTQTAILRVTDISSGFAQQASIPVAPSSNAPLNAQPSFVQFTGPNSTTCANGISADVIIFGGRPPYQLTQPPGFILNTTVVTSSGGRVRITSTGQCAATGRVGSAEAGQTMAIVDSNGATASVTIHNDTATATPQTADFSAAPTTVTLQSCKDSATVILVGGTGNYAAASGNSAVIATAGGSSAGGSGSIRRDPSVPNTLGTVIVSFSDGQKTKDVTVNLTGAAAVGACPP